MPQLTRPEPRTLSNSYGQGSLAGDQMSEIRSQGSHVSDIGSGPVSRALATFGAFRTADSETNLGATEARLGATETGMSATGVKLGATGVKLGATGVKLGATGVKLRAAETKLRVPEPRSRLIFRENPNKYSQIGISIGYYPSSCC